MNNDLISREALKNKFWHGELVPNKDMYHISEIMYVIDNAPTIDPIFGLFKEPHGKWKKQNCFYKCSVCGVCSPDGTDLHNFCSNCGAKMDGGEEE